MKAPVVASLVFGLAVHLALVDTATPNVFTNTFLVRLKGAQNEKTAHSIAKRNGFWNLGPVSKC